jgi:hypothetical protein
MLIVTNQLCVGWSQSANTDLVGHSQYEVAPKMAAALFAETLDNGYHSKRPEPESRSFTSNGGILSLHDLHSCDQTAALSFPHIF